ncbi:hypothetical protein K466DRAFT_603598 [Polyporus arcularius HHB13444]|uniref:C2H2-type domain-containing protein n=1 Tax=Polyporus arcularius HHB13444 TaxID=1314778 RepID=A0A5C3P0M3_9APHY|nr:hypothetical protein K466DRAFT_603598 [Polyporus arcularius HHB13444]
MSDAVRCLACRRTFKSTSIHSQHLGKARTCQGYYDRISTEQARVTSRTRTDSAHGDVGPPAPPPDWIGESDDTDRQGHPANESQWEPPEPAQKRRRVTVEDVEDEDHINDAWEYTAYSDGDVATPLAEGTTFFEAHREEQKARAEDPHAPFVDEDEWGLVQWLMRNTTQGGVDSFAKLPVTRNRTKPSFKNKKAFFKKIDKLPTGTPWICDIVTVNGTLTGPNGQVLTEELELWRRDPVECVRELIGNPAFKPYMSLKPVKVTRRGSRYYSEMNTSDWWWTTQGRLPSGATVAPLILASDKTTLTVLRGDKTAWPVYMSIGNIDKSVRRKPSAHAFVLLGYIPVAKLECLAESARSEAIYRLFHRCMYKILQPIVDAGRDGVMMTCADGYVRRVYPILAAYIADHPEQCLVACCKENRCPRCLVHRNERGDLAEHSLRSQSDTLDLLDRVANGETPQPPEFASQSLRPVFDPFWRHLPHTDIFTCISPDILHQIHKGVIKDHFLKWCQELIGEDELDARFAALPRAHGLRHFRKGISPITQWTGAEAKEVEKVLLGLLPGQVSSDVQRAARGLLDFVYFAQFEVHSDATLAAMETALKDFHRFKHAFVELGVRDHFNIPKLHSLLHYVDAIRRLGCLDGLNTETSERLHIDFAKVPYRASSRREYYAQMTTWLQRQEALVRQSAYLAWVNGEIEREAEEELQGAPDGTELDEEGDGLEQDVEVAAEDVKALRDLLHSNVARAFQLPLTPSARHVSFATLTTSYGAVDALSKLQDFLRQNHPTSPLPSSSTVLDVYHSIHVLLPSNIHIANTKRLNKLRASPAVPRRQDRKAIAACFDCGLFVEDEGLYRREGGLKGLRPGQIRAIIRLPQGHGYVAEPLIYVRWFRPFRIPDPIIGLPPTSHSTRDHVRNSSFIHARNVIRSCHLMPKFGLDVVDPLWKQRDIMDEPITFLLNRYYDFHMFCALTL